MKASDHLIAQVQMHYKVGPEYARAYLDYWIHARNRGYKNIEEIMNSPPPEPTWFDYAMSTNWRGQQILDLIKPNIPSRTNRYLDVGCGFGGCIVAFAHLGIEVFGIEIDTKRIQLAKANCADHNLDNCVIEANILREDLVNQIGKFDIITCMDVIEHVLDAERALHNLVNLLNPKGILILEIPNKDSQNFVACDGHFGLFGITLLERPDAISYHQALFSFEYDVGEYYDLDYYTDKLEEFGYRCTLLLSPLHPIRGIKETGRLIRATLQNYFGQFHRNKLKLPPSLPKKIRIRFAVYLAILIKDLAKSILSQDHLNQFKEKYLTDFWTLLVQK